ncbi:redoxin family protein [Acidimicrobiaceae bacterium USS-CC1]|jgi:peroxiredoxin|uniref:Glutathione-dependent peroxiredoxin n=1 Tax=Acidiferrimicrobium australe TaxID=2664430 RepID=A0ABW9QTI6_9ACTN|nr:redoxin family protein [Acidiferrimicrobium australe]HET9070399.1 peroxiredoxin [Acidimicrobiales bacterium]
MTIAVGDRLPDVEVHVPTADGPKRVRTGELLGSGTAVLFGVPGAFTPTCSDYHLPGFVLRADDLRTKGVGTIACMSVNDAFVMGAWGDAREVGDSVVLVADGSADLTRALGLELDLSGGGLGVRSQRFAMILQDGVVRDLAVEAGTGLDVSTADAVLAKL